MYAHMHMYMYIFECCICIVHACACVCLCDVSWDPSLSNSVQFERKHIPGLSGALYGSWNPWTKTQGISQILCTTQLHQLIITSDCPLTLPNSHWSPTCRVSKRSGDVMLVELARILPLIKVGSTFSHQLSCLFGRYIQVFDLFFGLNS